MSYRRFFVMYELFYPTYDGIIFIKIVVFFNPLFLVAPALSYIFNLKI